MKIYGYESDNFVYVDMNKTFPLIGKYCDGKKLYQDYHCRNLARLLFRAANYNKHKNNNYFIEITKNKLYNIWSSRQLGSVYLHHINNLMESNEPHYKIIKQCKQFEKVCDDFINEKQINMEIVPETNTD